MENENKHLKTNIGDLKEKLLVNGTVGGAYSMIKNIIIFDLFSVLPDKIILFFTINIELIPMPHDSKKFKDWVKASMVYFNIGQSELARSLNIRTDLVNKFINDKQNLKNETKLAIKEELLKHLKRKIVELC